MAVYAKTLHLHAFYTPRGEFSSWHLSDYKMDSTIHSSGFFVWVEEKKIEVEVPASTDDLQGKAVAAIDAMLDNQRKLHSKRIAALTFLRNNLLRLESPDVLDKDESADLSSLRGVRVSGEDDDIPF